MLSFVKTYIFVIDTFFALNADECHCRHIDNQAAMAQVGVGDVYCLSSASSEDQSTKTDPVGSSVKGNVRHKYTTFTLTHCHILVRQIDSKCCGAC